MFYLQIFIIIFIITIVSVLLLMKDSNGNPIINNPLNILPTNDDRILYEGLNGKKYKVRKSDDNNIMKEKADFLANLDDKSMVLINYMISNNLPDKKVATSLFNRYTNGGLSETPASEKGAAYAINKGPISICIFKDGKKQNLDDAFFVILHELAHLMSDSYGHGEEFQKNFNYIVKLAIKVSLENEVNQKLFEDPKFDENNRDYCGVKITSSPCDGDACTKGKLNKIDYFETLLDS